MQFFKSASIAFAIASTASALDWGNFSGEVTSINFLIGNDYSLTSDLVVSLNSSWSLVDIVGRRDNQIGNKTVVYNTADDKYYATINYTNTATSQNDSDLCFPAVPIRISLNEVSGDSTTGHLIDGSFYIGCIAKSRVANEESSSSSSTSSGASVTTSTTVSSSTSQTVVATSDFNFDTESVLSGSVTASNSGSAVGTVTTEVSASTTESSTSSTIVVSTAASSTAQTSPTASSATVTSTASPSSSGLEIVTYSSSVSISSSSAFEVVTSSFTSKSMTTLFRSDTSSSASSVAGSTATHSSNATTVGQSNSAAVSTPAIYSALSLGAVVLVFALFA